MDVANPSKKITLPNSFEKGAKISRLFHHIYFHIEKIIPKYAGVIIALLYGFITILTFSNFFIRFSAPDVLFHLREGHQIITTWKLPTASAQAFGLPNTPMPHEYLLYETGLAIIHAWFGFNGLRIFFILLATSISVILTWRLVRARTLSFAVYLILWCAGANLLPSLQQRPELLGTLLQLLLGWLFIRYDSIPRVQRLLYAFAIMFIWANVHASFIVGWIMFFLYFASSLLFANHTKEQNKNIAWDAAQLGVILLLGTVLTPHGLGRFLDPIALQNAKWSKLLSHEMYPLPIVYLPRIALDTLLVFWVFFVKRIPKKHTWIAALYLTSLIMAFISSRHLNIQATSLLITALYLIENEPAPRWCSWQIFKFSMLILILLPIAIVMSAVVVLCLHTDFPLEPPPGRFAQESLCALAKHASKPTPFLTANHNESYAIAFLPLLRPLADTGLNRFDQGTVRFHFYISAEPAALQFALAHLHCDYVVVNVWNAQWVYVLATLPDWKLVHLEDTSCIFARTSVAAEWPPITAEYNCSFRSALLLGKTDPLNTFVHIPHGMGAGSIPYMIYWLQKQPKDQSEKLLAKLRKDVVPTYDQSLLAISLHTATSSEVEYILNQLNFENYHRLTPYLWRIAGYSKNARDSMIPFRTFPESMVLSDVRHELGLPVDDELYWSAKSQAWMKDYCEKLNSNISKGFPDATPRPQTDFMGFPEPKIDSATPST